MLRSIAVLIVSVAIIGSTYGQELVSNVTIPVPTGVNITPPPGELVWNRFATKRFIIYSLDKSQGQWLYENIEDMRKWCLNRWDINDEGMNDVATIVSVPDDEYLVKYFGLQKPHGETQGGKGVLWLSLKKPPSETIPVALTYVSLLQANNKIPLWVSRGTSMLNGTLPQIKKTLSGLKSTDVYRTSFIEKMDLESFHKLTPEKQNLFDRESCYLVLMIRREFGQKAFHDVLDGNSLLSVTRFETQEELDRSFGSYLINLYKDIVNGKMPESYIQIHPPKGR